MKLTASNFAAAMGLSPWMSRQKLFRILTGKENREPPTAAMMWGVNHELDAVRAVEVETGLLFSETGKNQRHYMLDCFGATPDGRCGSTGLEVKSPQNLADTVPEHYLPQVQGQSWIAGFDTVLFGQWQYDETRIWTVARSDEYIGAMKELLDEFMQCLTSDTEPKRRKKPVLPTLTITRIN